MLAVRCRAYTAALKLWDSARSVAKVAGTGSGGEAEALLSMIHPAEAQPDDSPLFTICYNDTCSFTWTGEEHINQDIFECRTCGLTGSFCCCTECAAVCHRGHDCKLKRTSPTAYCDCWERCSCSALVSGNQTARFELLGRLLSQTDLASRPNGKGEHLLHFLVRTEARQALERRQHRPSRKAAKAAGASAAGAAAAHADSEMPDHDLEPPAFAAKAAEKLLSHWPALRSALALGHAQPAAPATLISETDFYLTAQSGVANLDQLVNTLIGKCKSAVSLPLVFLVSPALTTTDWGLSCWTPSSRRSSER